MQKPASSTKLHATKRDTLKELSTLQQKDSTLGFIVVVIAAMLTYTTYSVLNTYTPLTWMLVALATIAAGAVFLIGLFGAVSARTHMKNIKRRRSMMSTYQRELTAWLVANGKTGDIEYQGNILGDSVGVRHQNNNTLEYFTVVDTGKEFIIKN